MKMKFYLYLFMITLTACTAAGVSAAQQSNASKIDAKTWSKVQDKGTVRVIVSLNVPYRPERELAPDVIVTQRQAIAEAQDKLVAELDATTHKVNRRFTTGGIALLVGSDALAILERSELVKKVAEDIAMSPN